MVLTDNKLDAHVTVHSDKFLIIKPTRCTDFSKFILGMKLCMFWTVPLYIIRSFHCPARKVSANLYDIYHCCVYSGKLLTMDRGTVRNVEFHSKNKFEKLVHLVGFIIRKILNLLHNAIYGMLSTSVQDTERSVVDRSQDS
jgi:hypothetical protein